MPNINVVQPNMEYVIVIVVINQSIQKGGTINIIGCISEMQPSLLTIIKVGESQCKNIKVLIDETALKCVIVGCGVVAVSLVACVPLVFSWLYILICIEDLVYVFYDIITTISLNIFYYLKSIPNKIKLKIEIRKMDNIYYDSDDYYYEYLNSNWVPIYNCKRSSKSSRSSISSHCPLTKLSTLLVNNTAFSLPVTYKVINTICPIGKVQEERRHTKLSTLFVIKIAFSLLQYSIYKRHAKLSTLFVQLGGDIQSYQHFKIFI
ncbi:hypothetical protein ACTFIY_006748 [Dictyostelium cf. discoideum]